MAADPAQDQNLIRDTIADLDYTLSQLERQKAEIDARIGDVTARRDRWQKQLGSLTGNASAGNPRQRTPKGQNRETIKEYLTQHPEGASIPTIADKTGIGRSSVRTTLFQNKDLFVEITGGGAWMLKRG